MLVIVGLLIVIGSVFGGYLMEGGQLHVLIQPIELLIIGGAAGGSLLIAAPIPVIKRIIKQTIGAIAGHSVTREQYLQILLCLYEIIKIGKSNPLAIEPIAENPENSDVFKRYPFVLHDPHMVDFICDTLKTQLSSPMTPFDLEDLLDTDIATVHHDDAQAPATISRIGDAMPGLGIVAAVLGVVITMGKLTEGKEVIGHSVAAALVGTFLGILASYGFMQPLAAKMEANLEQHNKMYQVVKAALIAFAREAPPKACVEFARRSIPMEVRPSFKDIDQQTSAAGKKAA
jgi:chemotaxis protein MotA